MLTFTVRYLLKNPEGMRTLGKEMIGDRPMIMYDVRKSL